MKPGHGERHGESIDGASTSRLEDFARASSGWFWEMDAELRFRYMSPSVEAITGVAPQWHYGKTRAEIGIPESVSETAWQTHLGQLARRERFKDFVFQRSGPDGSKWMQTSGVPVFDDGGRFTGYRGVATDVTAQIQAEHRARRLEEAIENLNDLFVLWDESDRLIACNARFRALNAAVAETTRPGTRFEDYIRAGLQAGLYPEAAGREEQWFAERLARHRQPGKPFVIERQDGRWIVLNEHPLPDGSTATVSTDITEHKRAERELAEQHRILDTALRTIPDGVQVLDPALELVGYNDQLFSVMDLDREAILASESPGEAFRYALAGRGEYGPGDVETLVESRKAIARSPEPVHYERQLVTGKWIECRGTPIEGGGYVAVYRDIDDSRRLRETLERQASIDALTELLNRRRLLERLEDEFLRARRHGLRLSVLVADVDHFKAVNDGHGHAAGDDVLRTVASTCKALMRETDQLGRIGGEEFAAVLPETDATGASLLAERLRRTVQERALLADGHPFTVTISIGVAELLSRDASAQAMLAAADAALYAAKRGGRNRVVLRDDVARAPARRPCDRGNPARPAG